MDERKLIIAKELIEILAKYTCNSVGTVPENRDEVGVTKLIEAARMNYVLPSYCAERNTKVGKCIECIIENKPPEICRKKLDEHDVEEFDICWDVD